MADGQRGETVPDAGRRRASLTPAPQEPMAGAVAATHHYQHPPSHSYHSEPSHSYSSYQIDRAGEGGQQEDDCYKLDSPYKELCLLCGREETQERRELCMEDPCLLAGKERELCNSLTDQYLDMFRHQQS